MQANKRNIGPCLTAIVLRLNNIEACWTNAKSSEMKRINGMHTSVLVCFFMIRHLVVESGKPSGISAGLKHDNTNMNILRHCVSVRMMRNGKWGKHLRKYALRLKFL